jgi:NAD(P)-dependent dehydrogenase (short-subunit alcohol dehydrogenase family)
MIVAVGSPQDTRLDPDELYCFTRNLRRNVMTNPVVLITGALTGIGRAAAIIFAQEGAHIVVSGRRDKQGQELAAELQGLGAEAIFVRTDVRKDEDVRNLVDQTVKRFGRLDIAVNNAGTEGLRGLVTEQTAGEREHRQCLVGLRKRRRCRSIRLCS